MASDNEQLLAAIREQLDNVDPKDLRDIVVAVAATTARTQETVTNWLEAPEDIPEGDLPEILGAIDEAKQELGLGPSK